jgi:hypothetical protein
MSSDVKGERDDRPVAGTGANRYQECLRALGSWLDERHAAQFTVLETPENFIVILEGGPNGVDVEEVHFTRRELLKRDREMTGKRALIFRDDENEVSNLTVEAAGYRDVLRALGAELDEAKGDGIFFVKVGDGFVLTYNYVAATEGYFWHKRHVIVDKVGAEKMLTAAHMRRRAVPQRSSLRSLFRRSRS